MRTSRAVNNKGKVEKRNRLIEQYYNEIGSTMEFKKFEAICKTPFVHMRRNISNDKLFEMRFMHLGKFSPMPANVTWLLQGITKRFSEGLVEKQEYDRVIKMLVDYINDNKERFLRFKDKIEKWVTI